jgi:hypothetical protein
MIKVHIKIRGCDDKTEFVTEVNGDGWFLLKKIEETSRLISRSQCMPTFHVWEVKDKDD